MPTLRLSQILKKKFIGTEDLRRDLTAILKQLSKKGGEIIITQSGKPKAVLLDIDSYIDQEELAEQIADQDPMLIKHLNKIVDDVESGKSKLIPAEVVLQRLGFENV